MIKPCYVQNVPTPDFNLLVTLDVLLAEGSVARAARRLRLSPSAMSRALARLRETTGDPLLVRAGRGLVPTPRALELRERVGQLVQDGKAVLRPAEKLNLKKLVRSFTLRTSDGFTENFGPDLIARAGEEAPGVQLRFVQKTDQDGASLRDGSVDLETGVISDTTGPELRTRALFRDRFIGVVRAGHPLGRGKITPARYASGMHVLVSRRGLDKGHVDEALKPFGLKRQIVTIVSGWISPVAAPWTMRAAMTISMLSAKTPMKEPSTKTVMPNWYVPRRPIWRTNQSAISIAVVVAARKPDASHCAVSWPTPNAPITPGMATLTIVVARIVEIAPTVTVIVTSQRLGAKGAGMAPFTGSATISVPRRQR